MRALEMLPASQLAMRQFLRAPQRSRPRRRLIFTSTAGA